MSAQTKLDLNLQAQADQQESISQTRMGLAKLTRMAFSGQDIAHTSSDLLISLAQNPNNAGALMDLAIIEQLKGNMAQGMEYQISALQKCRVFKTSQSGPTKLKLLVLAAPIHMGGNTPIEFLLDGSGIEVITHYVVPGLAQSDCVPEHDLAFIASPGDSGPLRQFLVECGKLADNISVPLLNPADKIAKLERDNLTPIVSKIADIKYPAITRCDRSIMMAIANGSLELQDLCNNISFPVLARPVGSHAGRGLAKLETAKDIISYLNDWPDREFFLSEFVDYASTEDGRYRKYRIVFIDGKPSPVHMAIGDQWKLWYMNAGMEYDQAKRDEEAAFMADFEQTFAKRHQKAFNALTEKIGLEYFGIDCAEDQNGNLVLFEADNALIVHDMDCEKTYPYKKPAMRKLFNAFAKMLEHRA